MIDLSELLNVVQMLMFNSKYNPVGSPNYLDPDSEKCQNLKIFNHSVVFDFEYS